MIEERGDMGSPEQTIIGKTAAERMSAVLACGADAEGIADRFGDNAELFEDCFLDFLDEPSFPALKAALDKQDYKRAFDAAHALKGLSGNLGVTAFYDAICALVELLRNGSTAHLTEQYALVMQEKERLERCFRGEVQLAPQTDTSDASKEKKNGRMGKIAPPDAKNGRWFVARTAALMLVLLLAVGYLFLRVSATYRKNIVLESGRHLAETCNQIKLYIEDQIAVDWKTARTVADDLSFDANVKDDADVLSLLQRMRSLWGATNLILYTEDGFCMNADGQTEANDFASDTIARARQMGKYMTVLDSTLTYTVPVDTTLTFRDSRIAAVSVVRNMRTLLDEMSVSSFDSMAGAYLTEESGIIISMLSSDTAISAFNFFSIIDRMQVTSLSETVTDTAELARDDSASYILKDGEEEYYLATAPINTGDTPLRLHYMAPEAVVNKSMNVFSGQLTVFSMVIILLFGALAFATFLALYRGRKKQFDRQLMSRERMFDLLVENTRTALALFTVNHDTPDFISSNASEVTGEESWTVHRTADGYAMRTGASVESEAIRTVNEKLSGWDGTKPFKTGYIRNEKGAIPSYFEIQLYPVASGGDSIVSIALDATQAYEREEATRNALEMAMRSNEAKSRFLSNMSHDIRTPMNAIMNMTKFAFEEIDRPKEMSKYLHVIHDSAEHLLHLINDVLDMSRIESGLTVLSSEPFDIREVLRRQVEMIRPLCISKEQMFITDFDGLHVTRVRGDALKLSQIVINLLGNAVKFTPERGAVRVTASELPSLREDTVNVRLTVEDNGIGISHDLIPYIFEPFRRADDERVDSIEGTGLGLSISKSYVDAMGGTISCQSEEGEGSIFTVELFFLKDRTEPLPSHDERKLGQTPFLGMHCLVVEDNPTNQMIAKTLLERYGFLVDLAGDGESGVHQFLLSTPCTYDLIYMDIRMPGLNGYEATEQIRNSGHPQALTIPILAMTANAYAEDVEKARVAGMDGLIGKPIVSQTLVEETIRAIRKKEGEEK